MKLTTPTLREKASRAFPVASAAALLLFFSIGELFRHFFGLLAVAGLVAIVAERHVPRHSGFRAFAFAFLLLWLPILLSAVDAEAAGVTATTTARYLIYLFAGYLWITRFSEVGNPRSLLVAAFAILTFWSLDATFQLGTGVNFFGNEPLDGTRLTGMFGPRLGFVLAILAPVFFHAVYTFGKGFRWLWLLLFPYVGVILYGGSRVSWMLLAIAALSYLSVLVLMRAQMNWRKLLFRTLLITLIFIVAVAQTDWLKERFAKVAGLMSDDYETVNVAVSDRLPHWQGAVRMYLANPVNGIGAKGYKSSYHRYSRGDEIPRGQPHMFFLEVAAETGTIGLIGYGAFLVFILARLVSLVGERRFDAVPWGIALILAAFPLSATLSLYAHYMSAVIWFLAMVFFGVADYRPQEACSASPREGSGTE